MVAVVGPRALDEAVLEVVVDGRREHAIEPEHAGLLVELVLVPAAARDLDDDLDALRELGGHARTIPPELRPPSVRASRPARGRSCRARPTSGSRPRASPGSAGTLGPSRRGSGSCRPRPALSSSQSIEIARRQRAQAAAEQVVHLREPPRHGRAEELAGRPAAGELVDDRGDVAMADDAGGQQVAAAGRLVERQDDGPATSRTSTHGARLSIETPPPRRFVM